MLRSLTGRGPVVNTKPIRTHEYSVEIQCSGPAILPAHYRHLHLVTVFLSDDAVVVRASASGPTWTRFAAGESSLRAAGPGQQVEWPTGVYCLHLHLHPRLLRRLGAALWNEPRLSLDVRFPLHDLVIRDIGFELDFMVSKKEAGDSATVHELIMNLANHLVSNYAVPTGPMLRIGNLATEEIMDAFRDSVANWSGVSALAARAGLTRSHFARRVGDLTGLPPYAHVVGSRIEAAKHLLEGTDLSLSEVAYEIGFADQSHLTRSFRRAAGVTPARYRTTRWRL